MKQIVDKLNKIARAIDENVELSDRDLIIDSLDSITKAYGGTPNDSNLIVDKLETIAGVAHGGGGGDMPTMALTIINNIGDEAYTGESGYPFVIKEQYGFEIFDGGIEPGNSLTMPLLYAYDVMNDRYNLSPRFFYGDNLAANITYTDLVNCTTVTTPFGYTYLEITDPSLPSSATATLTPGMQ